MEQAEDESYIEINNQLPKFKKGTVILFWGVSRTGKTSFCIEVAYKALMDNKKVLYMDTEKKLKGERLLGFSEKKEDNVFCSKRFKICIPNTKRKIESAIKLISENKDKFDVVIIDSVYNPFSSFKHAPTRAKELRYFLSEVRNITSRNNFLTLLTTHASNNSDCDLVNKSSKPIGGEGLLNFSDRVIHLTKGRGTKYHFEIDFNDGSKSNVVFYRFDYYGRPKIILPEIKPEDKNDKTKKDD